MLPSVSVQCPYCGEPIELLIEDPVEDSMAGSMDQQSYVEDCPVCCRPIEVTVTLEDGAPRVQVAADSD